MPERSTGSQTRMARQLSCELGCNTCALIACLHLLVNEWSCWRYKNDDAVRVPAHVVQHHDGRDQGLTQSCWEADQGIARERSADNVELVLPNVQRTRSLILSLHLREIVLYLAMFRRLLKYSTANILARHCSKSAEVRLKVERPQFNFSLSVNGRNNLYADSVCVGTWRMNSSLLQKQEQKLGLKLYSMPSKNVRNNLRHFSEQVGSGMPSRFATGSSLGTSSSADSSKVDWRVKVRRAQRKRLYYLLGGLAALATLVYSALFAFEDNLMYFLTPTQALAKISQLGGERRFRLGGVVVNGSFMFNEKEKYAEFVVTDLENEIPVLFKGDTFPDLFGEGKSVVADGYFRDGIFYADKILAKHDEYYIPKGVEESIRRNPISIYGALKSANVGSRNY